MKKAFNKDIWRTVQRGKKRFFSIMLITILGVTMLSGLKAACVDLRYSADRFFDQQKLFDISIVSTLGLTDSDVDALKSMKEIDEAEGAYSETVHVKTEGKKQSVELKSYQKGGLNLPYVIEGALPEKKQEIAVTEKYRKNSGKSVGDELTIEEYGDTTYKITAIVTDATDINSPDGAVSFRSTTATDYTFFVIPESMEKDVYTAVYLTVKNSREIPCYSAEYESLIKKTVHKIEAQIKKQREQARYDEITGEAYEKLSDEEKEMRDQFSEAEKKLADAQKELDDGLKKLADGHQELNEKSMQAQTEIANAWQQIEDGRAALSDGERRLEESAQQISDGENQLNAAKEELEQKEQAAAEQFSTAQEELASHKSQTEEGITQLEEQISLLDPNIDQNTETLNTLQAQKQQLEAALVQIGEQEEQLEAGQAQAKEQFRQAHQTITDKETELAEGKQQLLEGQAALEESRGQLEAGAAELAAQQENAADQIAQGQQELDENQKKLEDGQKELDERRAEFEEKRSEAEEKLEDAREEIEEIDMAQWYVTDRSSLSGYANVKSDASSIEAIGTAFPIVFFIVAILISLTTITRMVEEDRGLIGTYKALGFTNSEIRRKYELYSLAACLLGGFMGNLCGFIVLPKIIFTIFQTMYVLPSYEIQFDVLYGVGGVMLFLVGIVGASAIACSAELKETPAVLMRPKAPGKGSRVFLERITPVWRRMSFLNKVTARNIFRYKKRLFMTAAGIMGCTALVLCGLVIKDSVTDLMPNQYEQIYQYDLMAVSTPQDHEKLLSYLDKKKEVTHYLDVRIDSVKLINSNGKEEKVQMFVIPDGRSLDGYIGMKNLDGKKIKLDDTGVIITRNASDVLHISKGEIISIQDSELTVGKAEITELTENYLGNNLFMAQSVYEKLFGEYEPNGVLADLSKDCTDQAGFADELGREDGVLSAVSTQAMKSEFSTAFGMINMVVYIIIFMAAGLALVVLFTLSTTNISERERELATIKVLGFFDREVHLYVNKETLILTGLGILLGLPLGYVLGNCLTYVLKMPSIHFAVSIHPVSYLIAALISFGFALMVDLITNRVLDGIDPVEALKSIE